MPIEPITTELIDEVRQAVIFLNPHYASMTPLEQHVYAFGQRDEAGNISYSTSSIRALLKQHGEGRSLIVGAAVSAFNAVHSGKKCPFSLTNLVRLIKQTSVKPST